MFFFCSDTEIKKQIWKKSDSNWHSNSERYFDPPGDTESKVQTNVIATTSEKAEKLKARLIKATDNTDVGLNNSRTTEVWSEKFDNTEEGDDRNYWKTESVGDKEKSNSN